jgi:hypothetical protein
MTHTEALRLALDALVKVDRISGYPNNAAAIEACRAALAAPSVPDIAAKLRDPVAVHAAMLRGEIATPAIRDMLHVYGADALARWDAAPSVPSGEPVAHVSECEACFTPDACQLRGTCDHYSAERLRVAAPQPAPAGWRLVPVELGLTAERHFALREAHAIGASDAYFKAWPTHDNDAGRMLFERGFVRGFDSHARIIERAAAPAAPGGEG